MLAFNFLFLPPLHTFTLADSRNWFALAVFLVTAIVVSELAARSRRQARESALLAEIATSLLERGEVSGELDRIAAEAARALQVERARIELGDHPSTVESQLSYPLETGGRRVGTIYLERPRQGMAAARRRLLPALASLLGVAIDRERLAREARRGRGAPSERRDQDGSAARGEPRPEVAADGNPHLGERSGAGRPRPRRGRPRRSARDRPGRGASPGSACRQPPRPVSTPGRSRRAGAGCGGDRRSRRAGPRGAGRRGSARPGVLAGRLARGPRRRAPGRSARS